MTSEEPTTTKTRYSVSIRLSNGQYHSMNTDSAVRLEGGHWIVQLLFDNTAEAYYFPVTSVMCVNILDRYPEYAQT